MVFENRDVHNAPEIPELMKEASPQNEELALNNLQKRAEDTANRLEALKDRLEYKDLYNKLLSLSRQLDLMSILVQDQEKGAEPEVLKLGSLESKDKLRQLSEKLEALVLRLDALLTDYEFAKDIVGLKTDAEYKFDNGAVWNGTVAERKVNGKVEKVPYGKGELAFADGRTYEIVLRGDKVMSGNGVLVEADGTRTEVFFMGDGMNLVGIMFDRAGNAYAIKYEDGVMSGVVPITVDKFAYRAKIKPGVKFKYLNADQVLVQGPNYDFILDRNHGLLERTPKLFTDDQPEELKDASIYRTVDTWKISPNVVAVNESLSKNEEQVTKLVEFQKWAKSPEYGLLKKMVNNMPTKAVAEFIKRSEQGYDVVGMLRNFFKFLNNNVDVVTDSMTEAEIEEAYGKLLGRNLDFEVGKDGIFRLGELKNGVFDGKVLEIRDGRNREYAMVIYRQGKPLGYVEEMIYKGDTHELIKGPDLPDVLVSN